MSEFNAIVVPVNLGKHPNADTLSIATVRGWQCVVRTADFQDSFGNTIKLGAYIPIGTVMPELPEWEFLKPRHYRVETIKLRDYLSQGLLIPAREGWVEGQDVTEELGVKKYEEPIPTDMAGILMQSPPGFQKYTDIQNFNDYPRVFDPNDEVVVTEKIHGSNVRYAIIGGTFYVGSHTRCLDPECAETNLYWQVARKYDVEAKLRTLFLNSDIQIFGEVYGPGVQDLHYGLKEPGLAIFDILVHGTYAKDYHIDRLARETGIPRVPVLYRGKFNTLVLKHAGGPSTLDRDTVREGIVMRSENLPNHPLIGRKILKLLNTEYLLRSGGTERH